MKPLFIIVWILSVYGALVLLYWRKEHLAEKFEFPLILLFTVLFIFSIISAKSSVLSSLMDSKYVLVPFILLWTGVFAALSATYQERFLHEKKLSDFLLGGFFSLGSLMMILFLLASTTI